MNVVKFYGLIFMILQLPENKVGICYGFGYVFMIIC